MGMFDSVIVRCPHCAGDVEFQSKAGECKLRKYTPFSVPPEIARALDGEVRPCKQCGAQVVLSLFRPIQNVHMMVRVLGDY